MSKSGAIVFLLLGMCLAAAPDHVSAADIDCRSCHLGNDPVSKARNFSYIYAEPKKHHSVSADYPAFSPEAAFNLPTARRDDVSFFDANGNGIPDADEIQLFYAKVECASCHSPAHGVAPAQPTAPPNPFYLRTSNDGSRLCMICHRQ